MRVAVLILTVCAIALSSDAQQDEAWKRASNEVVRLSPQAFTQLPPLVMDDLLRRGCLIPQTYISDVGHNVVRGSFERRGQNDWAVLCSIDGSSSVLVYWNDSVESVSEIAAEDDAAYLQVIGSGKIGFSRLIGIADKSLIEKSYRSHGGPRPPEITHDGIDDRFAEKASTVRYRHGGRWLVLQGAD